MQVLNSRAGGGAAIQPQSLPKLVVLDLNMPRTDGRDVIEELKGGKACAKYRLPFLQRQQTTGTLLICELEASSYIVKIAHY